MICCICNSILLPRHKKTCSIKCRSKYLSNYNKANNVKPPSQLGRKRTPQQRAWSAKFFGSLPHPLSNPASLERFRATRKKKYDRIGRRGRERDTIKKRPEYIAWRKAVFERDNYTCQMCSQRGGELQADHIKPFAFFPELRTELSNGRTLCKDCHRKTPTWGNRAIAIYA